VFERASNEFGPFFTERALRAGRGTAVVGAQPRQRCLSASSLVAGVETMRWLPTEHGIHTMSVVTGAKWNLTRSWLVNTNLLIRLTDTGLSARVTPSLSLDYAFER
jgi:hypothetical protein